VDEFVRGVDYYELLGVDRTASEAEIKSAYRALARAMHPDMGGTAGTFRLLREAYETLGDPVRRAEYDNDAGKAQPAAPGPARRRPGGARASRMRDFGEDPDFVPATPRLDPDECPWWKTVDPAQRVRYLPVTGPEPAVLWSSASAWLLLLMAGAVVELPLALRVLWLVLVVAAGLVVLVFLRRALTAHRTNRLFQAEFRGCAVFGRPEPDERAKAATGELLGRYLTRMPGARIFHGLSWPDSVFADIDHAVLCGRRLVLIESKRWLPGHYTADEDGSLWRNGHLFRGGATHLHEGVASYRELLPGIEVRGVLLIYPSRAGRVTTDPGDAPTPPMTPERFVRDIGGWLAADAVTVDRDAFRVVLSQVVPG
jgi:hypothetical protein